MKIENLKKYIGKCPLLKKGTINVNYIGDKPVAYSIALIPAEPIVKRYVDGGTLRQFLFSFSSVEAYDENTLENMKVAQFFQDFAAWIEEQDDKGNYPDVGDAKEKATRIEVLNSGYLFNEENTVAQFQIELKLTYKKER